VFEVDLANDLGLTTNSRPHGSRAGSPDQCVDSHDLLTNCNELHALDAIQ
jgi:hypothetical protein